MPDFDAAAAWAKETQRLLALVEDEAAWITRRQAVTPEALGELVARLKASVCEFLKKVARGGRKIRDGDWKN